MCSSFPRAERLVEDISQSFFCVQRVIVFYKFRSSDSVKVKFLYKNNKLFMFKLN